MKIITIKLNIVREGRGNGEELWGRGREAPAKNLKNNKNWHYFDANVIFFIAYSRFKYWNTHCYFH